MTETGMMQSIRITDWLLVYLLPMLKMICSQHHCARRPSRECGPRHHRSTQLGASSAPN